MVKVYYSTVPLKLATSLRQQVVKMTWPFPGYVSIVIKHSCRPKYIAVIADPDQVPKYPFRGCFFVKDPGSGKVSPYGYEFGVLKHFSLHALNGRVVAGVSIVMLHRSGFSDGRRPKIEIHKHNQYGLRCSRVPHWNDGKPFIVSTLSVDKKVLSQVKLSFDDSMFCGHFFFSFLEIDVKPTNRQVYAFPGLASPIGLSKGCSSQIFCTLTPVNPQFYV